MAYQVEITPRAERDLFFLYLDINAAESKHARDWYLGLREAILGLSRMSRRNPRTSGNKRLRHLLYGHKPDVYRVIFRVRQKPRRVEVLHIRHGARRRFQSTDLR
jgi:toxin ParE1/3/4